MKNIFLLLVLLIGGASVFAQTDTRYSMYMHNGLSINPAFAGNNNEGELTAFYRNQWTQIQDAPVSISLAWHNSFGRRDQVGLGVYLEHDRIGVDKRTNVQLNYAYRLTVGEGKFSFGLQGGLVFFRSQLTDIVTPEGGFDEVFENDDSFARPNFGVGLRYVTKNYYFGASIPHLLNYQEGLGTTGSRVRSAYISYLANAGARMDLGERLEFLPSGLFKYIPAEAPPELDLSAIFRYRKSFELGITYRTNKVVNPESLNFQVGYLFDNGVKIAYAYDYMISSISAYTSGSQEILVSYRLFDKNDNVKNPRYFR